MNKECLECRETLKGRADKKFCSDLCRNGYNNKLNSNLNNYMRNVNNILRRNRRILEELLPEYSSKASRSFLLQKGFDLSYFTHTGKTKKGNAYFCYEYGYLPVKENEFVLLKEEIRK